MLDSTVKMTNPTNSNTFFLTGAPKSGTTWLGKLLDGHPQIACKGEASIHFFGTRLSKLCNDYDAEIERRGRLLSEYNKFPPLNGEEFFSIFKRFIDLRLLAIKNGKSSDVTWVADKDPEHGPHIDLLANLYPEARFIHIVRDGRAVLISALHQNKRLEDERPELQRLDQLLDIAARGWRKRVLEIKAMENRLGNRYYELRYEDLISDPVDTMRHLFEYFEVDTQEHLLQEALDNGSFENMSKGRKNGEVDANAFIRKGIKDDWKNHLSPEQGARFDEIAGDVLSMYGYELSSPWQGRPPENLPMTGRSHPR